MVTHDSIDANRWPDSGEAGLLPGMLPLHVLARNGDSTYMMRALLGYADLDSNVCAVADEKDVLPTGVLALLGGAGVEGGGLVGGGGRGGVDWGAGA